MDLHTGAPFWLIRNGFGTRYPALGSAESCDVVVVGGGITGALCADRLTREGLDVVVLDQREPGLGSTAASTALLLYETDMELAALIDAVGHEAAVRAYALGREAVLEIGRLVAESGTDCDFDVMHSLYLAHRRRDAKRLQKETELRNRNGFEAFFLDAAEVSSRFGYDSRGAIESPGAARMDPLRFTRALLSSATRRGARVYARTAAVAYDTPPHPTGVS